MKRMLILERNLTAGVINTQVKKEQHSSPTSIKIVPTKVLKKQWLYGPATSPESTHVATLPVLFLAPV